jgi:voltage-gated potassium channel
MADLTDSAHDRAIDPDDPFGRLASYMSRTQTPLDVLALLTLWIVVVPPGDFGSRSSVVVAARVTLSAVYAVDLYIRARLAPRHLNYVRTHWLSLLVVPIPPLRVVFSLRLVRSVFRRGHLERFLVVALLLVVNGAVAVYFYERHAPGGNIHTLGNSLWWAMVTVTTVGYGDYYPVTVLGRVTSLFIMAIGILTLAVVTAQVASSFLDQVSRQRAPYTEARSEPGEVTLADLAERLARIEELLSQSQGGGSEF